MHPVVFFANMVVITMASMFVGERAAAMKGWRAPCCLLAWLAVCLVSALGLPR